MTRCTKAIERFQRDILNVNEEEAADGDAAKILYQWKDDTNLSYQHLQWATWLITSRVLTGPRTCQNK